VAWCVSWPIERARARRGLPGRGFRLLAVPGSRRLTLTSGRLAVPAGWLGALARDRRRGPALLAADVSGGLAQDRLRYAARLRLPGW
jgi:hypothetical protein